MKIIKLKEETHGKLMELGKKKETFDEIINRLIEGYEWIKKWMWRDKNAIKKDI